MPEASDARLSAPPCRVLIVSRARSQAEVVAYLLANRHGLAARGSGFADLGDSSDHLPPAVVVIDVKGHERSAQEIVDVVRAKWGPVPVLLLGHRRCGEGGTVGPDVAGWLTHDAPCNEVAAAIRCVQREPAPDRTDRSIDRGKGLASPPGAPNLTKRELYVLGLLADGRSNDDIAEDLGVTASTARTHVQNLMQKLGASSRLQAVAIARRDGLALRSTGGAGAVRLRARGGSPEIGRMRVLADVGDPLLGSALEAVLEDEVDLEVVTAAGPGAAWPTVVGDLVVDVVLVDALPWKPVASCRRPGPGEMRPGIILMSGGTDLPALMAALAAGANGFLGGECGIDDLVQAVRAVGGGGAYVPPEMLGGLLHALIEAKRDEDAVVQRFSRLSRREREVLEHLAEGADHLTIAQTLFISPDTARTHIRNILSKVEVHSRLEAVALATRHALLGARAEPRPLEVRP